MLIDGELMDTTNILLASFTKMFSLKKYPHIFKEKLGIYIKDLNKAYPKNDFPSPYIDVIMDNTTNSALISFMNGFFGYKQIKMASKDMTKTTFTTEWESFTIQ